MKKIASLYLGIHVAVLAIVFAAMTSVGSLLLYANQDDPVLHNCFDQVCFGPVHIFIENASKAETQSIADLSCRLTGINLTPIRKAALQEEATWSSYRNLVLFVDDLSNAENFHSKLVKPQNLAVEATRFGGTLSLHSSSQIYNTEFLVFDQLESDCDDWRCWIGVTYQFLEIVYDQKILVDKDKYADGKFCAGD